MHCFKKALKVVIDENLAINAKRLGDIFREEMKFILPRVKLLKLG